MYGPLAEQFHRDGFLILRNAIPPEHLEKLQRALFAMARRSAPDAEGHTLASLLQELERRDHAMVYRLQKAIGTSCSAMRVIAALDLGRLHAELYRVPEEQVHAHLFQTPIQFPNDRRFDFAWHQESGAYAHVTKILTCWFPVLGAVNAERGSVELIPGSHLKGKRQARHEVKASGLNDWVVEPDVEEVEHSVIAELEPGDVLVFDSDVIHRSVANRSHAIRITGIARTVDNCGVDGVMVMAKPANYCDQAHQDRPSLQQAGER
jgi:hypothetical protein